MKVFLTGATGFVGAHVARFLVARKHEVVVLARKNSDLWRVRDLEGLMTVVYGDMRKADKLDLIFQKERPECICHLAWGGVGGQHRNECYQLEENLPATIAMIRLAIEHGCKRFVGLGSQAEYGPKENIINEEVSTNPTTMYGIAKLAASNACKLLSDESEMSFAWLRLFSTYGPMDQLYWLIPYLITTMLKGESPRLTKGTQKWDYLYVEDLAQAIVATVEAKESGIYNLGSGTTVKVRFIAEMIRNMISTDIELNFGVVPFRPDQVMHLQADITRLKAATGWEPETKLEDGLAKTIAWFATCQRS